jgi:hypothetical protein
MACTDPSPSSGAGTVTRKEELMRRHFAVLLAATMLLGALALPAAAAPGGIPGSPIVPDAIYADGRLFGTIGLGPLPYNGNAHAFDQLFMFDGQPPVAEAAPGRGYNGGRWLPVPVMWAGEPYLLRSYAEVMAAAEAGDIVLGSPDVDGAFLCPLISGPRR